ncbi:MAG: MBL fold metallo-hydrolase [Phycisphaerae bacterium]
MAVDYSVISIGTLSHHRLWGESKPIRTAHATTTLLTDGDRKILVDPSLPGAILEARYNERTGGTFADVTDVFCTTLRPTHRRALPELDHVNWWAFGDEIDTYTMQMQQVLGSAERLDADSKADIEKDLQLLQRFRPAPDKFSEQVSVYPLAGPTPGHCGLLLTPATQTIVIAGDAAVTRDHVQAGQIWQGCLDREQAMDSLSDVLELAEVIIPGHDNVMYLPQRWM